MCPSIYSTALFVGKLCIGEREHREPQRWKCFRRQHFCWKARSGVCKCGVVLERRSTVPSYCLMNNEQNAFIESKRLGRPLRLSSPTANPCPPYPLDTSHSVWFCSTPLVTVLQTPHQAVPQSLLTFLAGTSYCHLLCQPFLTPFQSSGKRCLAASIRILLWSSA